MKLQELIKLLKKGITRSLFKKQLSELYKDLDFHTSIEILKAQGLAITQKNDIFYLSTSLSQIKDEVFCVVDIETNGSKPYDSQIIEIGAVKIQNSQIIDTFSELVHASYIPKFIQEITGINKEMLKTAKTQKQVLQKFREFIKDSIFVAHDSYFDFNYIKAQFQKENLGEFLNQEICTLTLAKKTLEATRYGLKYLTQELNLPQEQLHRALGDAKTTSRVMILGFNNLPEDIQNTNDLLNFAKGSKTIKNKILKKQKPKSKH